MMTEAMKKELLRWWTRISEDMADAQTTFGLPDSTTLCEFKQRIAQQVEIFSRMGATPDRAFTFSTPESRAKGGRARAAKLTPKRRTEIARKAGNVRWGNEKKKGEPS